MITFLAWPAGSGEEDKSGVVGSHIADLFAGLFVERPRLHLLSAAGARLAYVERPVGGWRAERFESDGDGWALAVDYPLNVRAALRAAGVTPSEQGELLTLARELERDPIPVLRELAPPFQLLWKDTKTGELRLANDGLGQAQTFILEQGGSWTLTNRVQALRALDHDLEPVEDEWAARLTLGWFSGESSGFKGVRRLRPGSDLSLGGGRVTERTHDVLGEWVNPEPRSTAECCDLALHALLEMARENADRWEVASAGLSGGWDSRAVVASLRSVGASLSPRVRGNPERYDVMIATKLAEIAGFNIRVKTSSGGPPPEVERCRQSIESALLWQAGAMPTLKHKTFLGRKEKLGDGVVNVMGQHGGLGKADFVVKIGAHDLPQSAFEDALLDSLLEEAPTFLRAEQAENIRERTRSAYRAADGYGLQGLQRLHFFYLYEYTRRWSSGALAAQPGVVYAPYLCPDFIRACFAYPAEELTSRPLHRHITGTLAPEWSEIPYTDQVRPEHLSSGLISPPKVKKRKRREIRQTDWLRKRNHRKYSYRIYWEQVGEPLVREAMNRGGFWTGIFDPDLVEDGWATAPDALVIAHLLPGILEGN